MLYFMPYSNFYHNCISMYLDFSVYQIYMFHKFIITKNDIYFAMTSKMALMKIPALSEIKIGTYFEQHIRLRPNGSLRRMVNVTFFCFVTYREKLSIQMQLVDSFRVWGTVISCWKNYIIVIK